MLNPRFYNAAGRRLADFSAEPPLGPHVQGHEYTAAGELIMNSSAPAGERFSHGFRLDGDGAIFATTTVTATDVFRGGLRFTIDGALVVAQADPAQICNGNPYDANGAFCIT